MKGFRVFIGTLFAVTIVLAALPRPASAVGFGVYGTGSIGSDSVSMTTKSNETSTTSGRVYHTGVGLVIDTATAKDKLFNYRLNLGYGKMFDNQVGPLDRMAFQQISWGNTFGFGFYRTPMVRLWVGPMLSLAYIRQAVSTSDVKFYGFMYEITKLNVEFNHLQLNLGAVFGINVNPGNHFTISWELGFQGGFGIGKLNSSGYSIFLFIPLPQSASVNTTSYNIEAFTRISVMFRVGDTFRGADKGADKGIDKEADKKQVEVQ